MSVRAAVLGLLLAACASASPEVSAAADRGRADALRDAARGRPREAFIGFVPDDASALDAATGRVRFSVACCKTHEWIAYCRAYNDAAFAGPSAGFARRATTRAAVEALFADGAGTEIRRGERSVDVADGRFHVEVAAGIGRDAIALWSTDRTTGERTELRYLGSDRARIVAGADGTTLFVRDDAARAFSTFDLPAALFLEVFPDPPRER